MEIWLTAVTTVGFPIVACFWFAKRSDKDKKEYADKLDKKDVENREFTNKLVDNLNKKVEKLEDERRTDKMNMETMIKTNAQLSDTNSKLYDKIDNMDSKIEGVSKKVDKIETIVTMNNKLN